MIETQRRQGDQITSETRYYISSRPADARTLLQAVRSHWGIENALHRVLDMAFREDASRIRTGHASRRKQTGWNDGYLLKVLSNWNAIALAGCAGTGKGFLTCCGVGNSREQRANGSRRRAGTGLVQVCQAMADKEGRAIRKGAAGHALVPGRSGTSVARAKPG